jgi:hypothetical protein
VLTTYSGDGRCIFTEQAPEPICEQVDGQISIPFRNWRPTVTDATLTRRLVTRQNYGGV